MRVCIHTHRLNRDGDFESNVGGDGSTLLVGPFSFADVLELLHCASSLLLVMASRNLQQFAVTLIYTLTRENFRKLFQHSMPASRRDQPDSAAYIAGVSAAHVLTSLAQTFYECVESVQGVYPCTMNFVKIFSLLMANQVCVCVCVCVCNASMLCVALRSLHV
jgi:hypothetical protein